MTDNSIYVFCPHCNGAIVVQQSEINCGIFRHGTYLENNVMVQLNPHLPKNECENMKKIKKIYGCTKPFRLTHCNGKYQAEICDYI